MPVNRARIATSRSRKAPLRARPDCGLPRRHMSRIARFGGGRGACMAKFPAGCSKPILQPSAGAGGPSERLRDGQYRIEESVVHAFTDRVVRIDNPQALMVENQISLAWLPDKGDLTVHRLEIRRGGEVIDLLAQGVVFAVIRREQGLEQRLIDGELTATLSVPACAKAICCGLPSPSALTIRRWATRCRLRNSCPVRRGRCSRRGLSSVGPRATSCSGT